MARISRPQVRQARRSTSARSGASFFVLDRSTDLEVLERIGHRAEPIFRQLRQSPGEAVTISAGPSEQELSRAVEYAIRKLPRYLRAAGRPTLTAAERDDVRRVVTGFLKDWISSPALDIQLIRANTEVGGFRGASSEGPILLADKNQLILADEHNTMKFGEGPEESANPTAAKGAFIVDILLEIMGLILGIIGVGVPKSAQKGFVRIVDRMLEDPRLRKAFAKLLRALRSHRWKEVLKFFEEVEEYGNIYELFAHFFANLSRLDFIITIAKILAWVAALASGTGWAAALIKIGEVALDLIGIANKVPEIEKLGW